MKMNPMSALEKRVLKTYLQGTYNINKAQFKTGGSHEIGSLQVDLKDPLMGPDSNDW